ncbi:MAG: MerR family transcriptional regulator, partial [Alphaproteobacteria bacterium]|nr:MerR family transcriptional regulator [Alphaproteobacteria bacterium]
MTAEKSVSAYKTISEASKLIDVPSHVLRFWETKFTQVKPIKRSGGRRYYRSEDIEVLSSIRELLYNEGYTIKGAQKVLKSHLKNTGSADNKLEAVHLLDEKQENKLLSAEQKSVASDDGDK